MPASFTTRYGKVWKVFEPKEKSCLVSISTKSNGKDNSPLYSRWSCFAIGHALQQIKSGRVKEGDTVAIVEGSIEDRGQKDEAGKYHQNVMAIVYEFAEAGSDPRIGKWRSNVAPASQPTPTQATTTRVEVNDIPW